MTPLRQFATISNALDEALVYFKDREDADDGIPNECMRLALGIEQAQAALVQLQKDDDVTGFGR